MSTKRKPLEKAIGNIDRLADQLATEHRKMWREQARTETPATSDREPDIVWGADIKIESGGPDSVYQHIQKCILLSKDERMVLRHAEVLIRHIGQAIKKYTHHPTTNSAEVKSR